MKFGFLKIAYRELELRGYLSMDEVHQIAKNLGRKESYAEKELRADKWKTHPHIRKVKQPHPPFAITGYRWVEDETEPVEIFSQPQQAMKF